MHRVEPAQPSTSDDDRGLIAAIVADGRPLLGFVALMLVLCGAFALFLAATGHFLPHDERFLGMTAEQLCGLHGCRIVHFMHHDRGAFGGALMAIGSLYLWLVAFPLRQRQAWAWWTLALSGALGFASFLAYLGYGYLDSWHGVATLLLLPCYIAGMYRAWWTLDAPRTLRAALTPAVRVPWWSRHGAGRACLLLTSATLAAGGIVILSVGMTAVFVPQDLAFMQLRPADLHAINPRLVPLIAHDRAGFGGALLTVGLTVFVCVWCARPSRSLRQILLVAGTLGFGTAIGVHPLIGYLDPAHLAPAVAGAVVFYVGLGLMRR